MESDETETDDRVRIEDGDNRERATKKKDIDAAQRDGERDKL